MWARAWARAEGPAARREEAHSRAKKRAKAAAAERALRSWEWVAWEERWGEAIAMAQALALAGVWIWARSEARARGESIPSGLADSATIRRILSVLHRHTQWVIPTVTVARDLWHHSPKTRDEYSSIIQLITPISSLPLELLRQVFLIIIDDEASSSPSVLLLVCKHWHLIVTSMWAALTLGSTTPIKSVTSRLESSQWLNIVVDTDSDRRYFTRADGAFESIFAAIEASSRWRSLTVKSFPAQADLPKDLVNRCLQPCSDAPMNRFTTFKIMFACETSPLLNRLLRILGTTAGPELTTVEINSANVISSLASAYPSMFHSVKFLSLNTPGIPNPVDLLPHLHQLESFTASHISFPIYHDDIDLPFIHTLRHLRLRAAPIQWMSGRTFHVLEACELIFPLHRHILHTFRTTLPNCKHLTFQGFPLDIVNSISAPKLTSLSVTCSDSFNGRGNHQFVQLSRHVLADSRLALKILHIGIEATNKAWVNALNLMSDLEELVIESAGPSSLGANVFQSLIVLPVHASDMGTISTPIEGHRPLCGSLKRFGLKYRRWLRQGEQFNLIPDIVSVIQSRGSSSYPLQSFSIWMTSNQEDPLELVEESQMSREGLQRLANKSEIKKRDGFLRSLRATAGSTGGLASQRAGPRAWSR